jgi:hypothetical protein
VSSSHTESASTDVLEAIELFEKSANGRRFDCLNPGWLCPPMDACAGCVIRRAKAEIVSLRTRLASLTDEQRSGE